MECKSGSDTSGDGSEERINRYIMECKCVSVPPGCTSHQELIDTLWNVNIVFRITHFLFPLELIDTLWNVNLSIIFLN